MSNPSHHSVTLGLVQHHCVADPAANMRKAVEGVREAARRGAQIICLHELFRNQYFCQVEDHRYFELRIEGIQSVIEPPRVIRIEA